MDQMELSQSTTCMCTWWEADSSSGLQDNNYNIIMLNTCTLYNYTCVCMFILHYEYVYNYIKIMHTDSNALINGKQKEQELTYFILSENYNY